MKLTSMQFDGDGGYDTPLNSGVTAAAVDNDRGEYSPMNAGATASSAVKDNDDGAARRAAAAGRAEKMDTISRVMTSAPGIPGDDAHKGKMARSNAMTPMTPSPSKVAPKATKAVDKSGYNRSVKVSQSTVNAVKDAGRGNMGKVPQDKVKNGAPGYNGSTFSPNAPVSAEYKEAVTRVYPNAAKEPKAATPKAAPKNYGGPAAEKYKAEEKNAKNKSAFPSILPAPTKPKATPNPNSAATMPPLLTPSTTKPKAAVTTAKVKVSQATVDAVKKAGKEKSIGATQYKGVSPEYKEAVRRIYQSPAKPKPAAKKSGGGGGKASAAVK